MIWTPTSELMVIATAAFCISFGVIYTLIACYKWKRKHQSEEHEKLRDELLRQKFLSRRKSTSLTSPPSTVVNPNYSAAVGGSGGLGSPYKVPTRHLRSTSASYSPTHYLSPHHRRMSTPTHHSTFVKTGVCCKTNCDHALPAHTVKTQQLSPNHIHLHHHPEEQGNKITVGGGYTDSPSRSVLIIVAEDDRYEKRMTGTSTPSPLHTIKENPRSFLLAASSPIRNSPSHKSKPIPSKLNTSWNQKSFSFGPIPPPRRDRIGYGLNSNYVENNKDSTFSLACYTSYEEEDSNGNEESERRPLLPNKNSTQRISNQKTDNYSIHHRKNGNYQENDNDNESSKLSREKFAKDSEATEERDSNNWRNCKQQPLRNSCASRYPNSPKLLSKEQLVLEEIPYYIEEQNCN